MMNKHCRVEVTGLVYVGNKLSQHEIGATMLAVFYHIRRCLLDYIFTFLLSASLIVSIYFFLYIFVGDLIKLL